MTSPLAAEGTSRRRFLAFLATCFSASMGPGCGAAKAGGNARTPEESPLRTRPLSGLVPSAGLRSLVIMKPAELLAAPKLQARLMRLLPSAGLDDFAAMTGVDVRQVREAILANFGRGKLVLAQGLWDPRRVEERFRARLWEEGKTSSRHPQLVRISGRSGSTLRTLVLAGVDSMAIAFDDSRLASAVEGYALGRLRVLPALEAIPLADLAARFGDESVSLFAPGPFEGTMAHGLRGILRGATAAGCSARLLSDGRLEMKALVLGDWSEAGAIAEDLLRAVWTDLATSPVGRLLALDRPSSNPEWGHDRGALSFRVQLDALALLQGLEDLIGANSRENPRG